MGEENRGPDVGVCEGVCANICVLFNDSVCVICEMQF